jgi:hypothetical protein
MRRPDPSTNALVERIGCQVSAPGPADRPQLGIDTNLNEPGRCPSTLEYRPTHATKNLYLALEAICERDPQGTMPRNLDIDDVWS